MTSTPQLCIVDDAADYRFMLQQLFKRYLPAYSVTFFEDAKGLLDELGRLNRLPNLIILDQQMPGLDGYQTLLQLKEHPVYKIIPVVIMSADASASEIRACYEAGVNSFQIKPTSFDSLKEQMALTCQNWLRVNC